MKYAVLLASFLSLPAFADCGPYPDLQDHYFDSKTVQRGMIPPPPANGSPEDRADLQAVKDWTRTRTKEMCDRFAVQKNAQIRTFFSQAPNYTPEQEKIFCRVISDVTKAVGILKDSWGRPRPPARDSSIRTCPGGSSSGQAYPSGHAAISRAYALLLAQMDPANANRYFEEAKQAGLYRVIGSVHHPLDIIAGAELSDVMFAKMLENPAFQEDLKKLKP